MEYLSAAQPRSEIYLSLPPAINSRRVDLLDLPRLVGQLTATRPCARSSIALAAERTRLRNSSISDLASRPLIAWSHSSRIGLFKSARDAEELPPPRNVHARQFLATALSCLHWGNRELANRLLFEALALNADAAALPEFIQLLQHGSISEFRHKVREAMLRRLK